MLYVAAMLQGSWTSILELQVAILELREVRLTNFTPLSSGQFWSTTGLSETTTCVVEKEHDREREAQTEFSAQSGQSEAVMAF